MSRMLEEYRGLALPSEGMGAAPCCEPLSKIGLRKAPSSVEYVEERVSYRFEAKAGFVEVIVLPVISGARAFRQAQYRYVRSLAWLPNKEKLSKHSNTRKKPKIHSREPTFTNR